MIEASKIAERALTILVLIGFFWLLWKQSNDGDIKDFIKDFFKGDEE